jgi:hypothetical protein
MHSVPSNFWQWVSSLNSEDCTGLILAGLGTLVLIILIVAVTIHNMHRNRLNDSLKRELLDRGMSADEIATIVKADHTKCGPWKAKR